MKGITDNELREIYNHINIAIVLLEEEAHMNDNILDSMYAALGLTRKIMDGFDIEDDELHLDRSYGEDGVRDDVDDDENY